MAQILTRGMGLLPGHESGCESDEAKFAKVIADRATRSPCIGLGHGKILTSEKTVPSPPPRGRKNMAAQCYRSPPKVLVLRDRKDGLELAKDILRNERVTLKPESVLWRIYDSGIDEKSAEEHERDETLRRKARTAGRGPGLTMQKCSLAAVLLYFTRHYHRAYCK